MMKKNIILAMILWSSIAYISAFILYVAYMFECYEHNINIKPWDVYYIILSLLGYLCLYFWIYSIVLWNKYDKHTLVILGLIFLNVFYMPWFYFRIKKIIH